MVQVNISGQNPSQSSSSGSGGGNPRESAAFADMRAKFSDQLDALSKRSNDPLSPSAFSAVSRSVDRLEATIRRFESRVGGSLGFSDRLSAVRQGMGSPDNAYKVSQLLRMSNIAQGAGIRGGLSGNFQQGRISEELRQIEGTLLRQLRAETDPTSKANLQRQVDAIYVAKSCIAANGSPGVVGSMAQAAGAFAGGGLAGKLGIAGAAVGATAAAAYEIAEAPYNARTGYANFLNKGREYRDFRIGYCPSGARWRL